MIQYYFMSVAHEESEQWTQSLAEFDTNLFDEIQVYNDMMQMLADAMATRKYPVPVQEVRVIAFNKV